MSRAENVDRPLLQGSVGSEKDNCSHSSINYRRNTPRHPRLEHNEYWRVSANTCMHALLSDLFLSLIHRESGKDWMKTFKMEWTGFGSDSLLSLFPKGSPDCRAGKVKLAAHGSDTGSLQKWGASGMRYEQRYLHMTSLHVTGQQSG